MILPSKHMSTEGALVGLGADVLMCLDDAKTVSVLFQSVQNARESTDKARIHFDWFLLALDFLFALDAIRLESDLIRTKNK